MTLIAGYDGRPQGRGAIALGAALARATGEPLVVACVYPSGEMHAALSLADSRARAQYTAEEALKELNEGVEAKAMAVPGRSTARGLHDLAEREGASALVVGSSHRGALGRVLAGNVAIQLLSGSPCPVAVTPRGFGERAGAPLRTIAVAFDDGPESWSAVQAAAALATGAGARVRLVHVLEPLVSAAMSPEQTGRLMDERRAKGEFALDGAVASLSKEVPAEARLVAGDVVRGLELEAHKGLDLLVVGSRGFGPVRRVLLGSTSTQLVRLAPCPVLVVPRSVELDPSAAVTAGSDEIATRA